MRSLAFMFVLSVLVSFVGVLLFKRVIIAASGQAELGMLANPLGIFLSIAAVFLLVKSKVAQTDTKNHSSR